MAMRWSTQRLFVGLALIFTVLALVGIPVTGPWLAIAVLLLCVALLVP
jgi:hypothetical protein